jgi:predicted short-subunit dehydrogenase-like oxidoreductase (DUF2520 family)
LNKSQHKSIVLIGSGNVATQLGLALLEAGYNILQVYSRTKKSANKLATLLKATATDSVEKINTIADIYIIAVKDDAIANVTNQLKLKDKITVHTSGSIDMKILKNTSKNYGVFYPLQTFSKNKKTDFKNIPICLEGSNTDTLKVLRSLADSISNNVQKVNSEQRKQIHLAAVFACNFTNHFYTIAENILHEQKLSFDILKPLIIETADKIKENSPSRMQTGPAIRKDKRVIQTHMIQTHMKLLRSKKLKQLYKLISENIIDSTKNNK